MRLTSLKEDLYKLLAIICATVDYFYLFQPFTRKRKYDMGEHVVEVYLKIWPIVVGGFIPFVSYFFEVVCK